MSCTSTNKFEHICTKINEFDVYKKWITMLSKDMMTYFEWCLAPPHNTLNAKSTRSKISNFM